LGLSLVFVAGASGAGLPDGRVVELVSTSGNVGEVYEPASTLNIGLELSEHPFEAAEDGEAVTYVGEPPATGGTGETGPAAGNQWLATRTAEGWKTQAITPPLRSAESPAYQAFSPDLESAIFQGGGEPLASGVPIGCRSLYSRSTATSTYSALFTNSEAPESETTNLCGRPLFAGAAEHESDIIFQSEAALTSSAKEATELPPGRSLHSDVGALSGEPCMYGCNLYKAKDGHLQLVDELEGKPVSSAVFGGYPGEQTPSFPDLSNVISSDGSRIFWTDTQPGLDFEHVFVFEEEASNVQVSGAEAAKYWTATPDGRLALYTEAGSLWQFDTRTNTREPLTGEGAGVLGVIGTNQTGEDASYIYFVAEGVLAGNENGEGETAIEGEPNIYLIHNGTTVFVATLSFEDNEFRSTSEGTVAGGDWMFNVGQRTAAPSPDGRHLVFQSRNPLTGYDNTIEAGRVVEAFVYSADDAVLACASCDPSGARPVLATEKEGSRRSRLPVSNQSFTHLRRWMSGNGNRVFFDSEQPLVPGDLNGTQDVYEWEREGTGMCAAQIPPRLDHGCVSLLSGAGGGYSFLVDADASGDNVFLEHRGPLGQVQAARDRNELYDVRVNGGFPQTSLACSGTGCQGVPPAPPLFATPASVTFAGAGNFPPPAPSPSPSPKPLTRAQKFAKALRACRAKPKRERAVCERRARRQYRAKSKPKAKRSQTKGSR
jgi:hypothetical protein